MHENAIHDLALAYWSVRLSPIKRAASLSNRNSQGKVLAARSLHSQQQHALRFRASLSRDANQNAWVQRARAVDSIQVKTAHRGLRLQPFVRPPLSFYDQHAGKRRVRVDN